MKIDYIIEQELKQLRNTLEIRISEYKDALEASNERLSKRFKSIQDLGKALEDYFINFNYLNVYNKRMIIHTLVEKVTVNVKGDDEILMEITLNPNKDILLASSD